MATAAHSALKDLKTPFPKIHTLIENTQILLKPLIDAYKQAVEHKLDVKNIPLHQLAILESRS